MLDSAWLFSQISRVRPRENFHFNIYMAIYSIENITKLAKLSNSKFPNLVQNRKNICTRNIGLWHIQYM